VNNRKPGESMKMKIAVSRCFVDTIQIKTEDDRYRFVVAEKPWVVENDEEVSIISPEVEIESDTTPPTIYKAVKIRHQDKGGKIREGWVPTSCLKGVQP
jgi:hypothetical protein